jgi:hypothetical protein
MALAPVATDAKHIANKALILLGSGKRVETFDDRDSTDTSDLIALWDIARRAAIVLHPFNFALARTAIDRDPGPPRTRGPLYSYTKPITCLRWLPWSREDDLFFDAVEEGGKLLCDEEGPIVMRFLRDVTETSAWSPMFVDVMAYTLAIEYCQAKTQLLGLRDRLTNERGEKLSEAKRIDGLASPNRRASPSIVHSRWAGARFARNGYRH